MRVLFLEDEEAIRGFVRINLKRNGMDITEAEDGESALELAKSAVPPFDIALLDVMLPTISGFEVCEQLRQLFPRMGIIMLTAKSQEEDKIRGLELGADDYVQKPFSPGELIARLNALKRRMMPYGEQQAGEAGAAIADVGGEGEAGAARESSQDGAAAIREAVAVVPGEAGALAGGAMREAGAEVPGEAGALAGGAIREAGAEVPCEAGALAGGANREAGAVVPGEAGALAGGAMREAGAVVPGAEGAPAAGGAAAAGGIREAGAVVPGAEGAPAAGGAAGAGGMLANGSVVQAGGDGGAHQPPAVGGGYRRPMRAGDIYSGPFLLSSAERRLWKDQTEIVLTPTEWTLVKLLMEREGEGLSRDDILNAVWGRHYVGDLKIVDVNIRRIRQKLEIVPSDPKHIETLWGYGYRWNRSGGQ